MLATYYGVDSLFSYFWGFVVRALGRPIVFGLGMLFNVAAVASMFIWNPKGDDEWVLYVLASLWGIADAVWQTQM